MTKRKNLDSLTLDMGNEAELETRQWEYAKYLLRSNGLSFSDIAKKLEVRMATVCSAKHKSYPRVERAIAEAIDYKPEVLWPQRYGD